MGWKTERGLGKLISLLILCAGLALVIIPIWYMIVTSFKPQTMIFELPPRLWPQIWTLKNYTQALSKDHFGQYFLNSLWVTLAATIFTLSVSSMLAFVFARLHFPGK